MEAGSIPATSANTSFGDEISTIESLAPYNRGRIPGEGKGPMRKRLFILIALFAAMAGAGVPSAQVTARFRADRARLEAAVERTGLTEHEVLENQLRSPFTSPGVRIQKVLPGSSLAVTVRGDFPAGTTILSERDEVTLSGAALSTTTYSARLTIPPDAGPGFVRLWAFTRIGIKGAIAVALVDTLYRFDLKSPKGYTVKVVPIEKTYTVADNKRANVKYQAEFYKPGESKPFETVTGYQTFYVDDAPLESHTPHAMLMIGLGQSTTSPEAEIEDIGKKMGDPNITEAERNALMARMGEVQRKRMEDMTKGFQTDPATLNKKQDDFGCGDLRLYPSNGGLVEGAFGCGKNFNGGELKVTGTMTQAR
jgi:hypothetical protein